MEAGIRERERYRDMSWLMPSIDLEKVFAALGVIVDHKSRNEIRAFCPDHHLYVGRKPSDPHWTLNVDTGETFCFTEGRGSNLVWIVCRLLKCEPDEAAKFLTGSSADVNMQELTIKATKHKQARLRQQTDSQKDQYEKGPDAIARDLANRRMSAAAYQFFIHPPGKKYPTNIRKETVDHFRVFERTWGYYSDRVVIPFFMADRVIGFVAVDILGKQEWIERHPLESEKKYRKVLYPMDFISGNCLYGFDECQKGAEYLILVEGARERMKLWQEGFPNTSAILGSYLSDEQMKLLGRLSPQRVILMFDGDDPGVDMTRRIAERLSHSYPGDRVQKCMLPRGRDPKTLDHDEIAGLIEKG